MSSRRKKLLIVYQGCYPWEVRIEKFCDTFNQAGYETTILCRWNGEAKQNDTYKNTIILRVGFNERRWRSAPISYNPFWKKAIQRAVAAVQPDLIISREMLLTEACAKSAAGRIPVVMDMAEHYPAALRSWKKYRKNPFSRLLIHNFRAADGVERRAVSASDGIITVCSENLERVARAYEYGRESICIVHNTPPLHQFDGVRTGSSSPPCVFSYQGWITKERGVENLVKAFSIAAARDPMIRLHVAGSGESFAQVQHLAQSASVSDHIELSGKFDHSELNVIMSQCDIGVIPFDDDEFRNHTIPNKLFDFMICAKPVIVSECAPLARIVHESKCGIVVRCSSMDQLANGILSMKEMDLESMSRNALNAARTTYNWEHDSKTLLKFIAGLLD